MDTFAQKLSIGEAGEILTFYYLQDVLKKNVIRSQGFDRNKDFIVNGQKVELKTDIKSALTGNVAIEKISLHTHTAPIILTLLPRWFWSYRTDLQYLASYWPDVVPGGDDGRENALFKIDSDTFKENYKPI